MESFAGIQTFPTLTFSYPGALGTQGISIPGPNIGPNPSFNPKL